MKINIGANKLFGSIVLSLLFFAGFAARPQRTEPQGPVGSDWSFSVKQDQVAQSDITARNICFKRHRFHVELQNLPFMKLLGPATFQVNAGSDYKDPVRIDATGLKPGDYEGTAVVICETCPKEKGCTQDRQNLHVRMTVTSAMPMDMPQPQQERACNCTIDLPDDIKSSDASYFPHFSDLTNPTKKNSTPAPFEDEKGNTNNNPQKDSPVTQIKLTLPSGTVTLAGDGNITINRVIGVADVTGTSGQAWRMPKDKKHKSEWYSGTTSRTVDPIYDGACDGEHKIKEEKGVELVILNAPKAEHTITVTLTFPKCTWSRAYVVTLDKDGKASVRRQRQ